MGDKGHSKLEELERGSHFPLLSHRCKGWTCKKCPTLWKYFVTGEDLRGVGDNATWKHDATVDLRGRPYPKYTRARWRRVSRRWILLGGPLLLLVLWLGNLLAAPFGAPVWPWPWILTTYVTAASGACAWLGISRLVIWLPDRHNLKQYIRPAAKVLCDELSIPYRRRDARSMINLPRGFGSGRETDGTIQEAVRVTLPVIRSLTDPAKRKLATAVSNRLGMPGATATWRESGSITSVDLVPVVVPPKSLAYAEVRHIMAGLPIDTPLAGLAAGRKPVLADLNQAPHLAFSGKTGTGKSVLLKALGAQRMSHGVGVMVLDYKRGSHKWLIDMPTDRAVYCYRIEDIHAALEALNEELKTRISSDMSLWGSFRELDIWVEEINATITALRRYWSKERNRKSAAARSLKKAADQLVEESDGALTLQEAADAVGLDLGELVLPAQSPAVDALQALVQMGRELQIHVYVAAQRLSANVFGGSGGDVRESFDLRFMARWDAKLWKMLVDGLKYVACPAGPKGIWGAQVEEDFVIFRVPWLTDEEARTLALGGAVSGPILGAGPSIPQEERLALPETVTLLAALPFLPADAGGDRLSLQALRKASSREGFPPPIGLDGDGEKAARLYSLSSLITWREERVGVRELER